ncbi:MAG: rRNA maturation RNase YbeY [Bacteroidales bacterium]
MISFSTIETKYNFKNRLKIRKWVQSIMEGEVKLFGDISYVLCNDEYLLSMNNKYLKHDTLTDIITFDYSENGILAGDIFISIERVIENAKNFKVSVDEELGRVMAHGVLHLSGYKDKKLEDKKLMRSKEDYYLKSFPNL